MIVPCPGRAIADSSAASFAEIDHQFMFAA